MALHRKSDFAAAVDIYQQLLVQNSNQHQAWTNMGVALRQLRQFDSALNCQLRALSLRPEDSLIYSNLGNLYKDMSMMAEAVRCGQRACELEPENAGYWFNLAVNLREAKRYQEALEALHQCTQLDSALTAKCQWEMALCYLYLGKNTEGWGAYRARLKTGVLPPRKFYCPEWRGEPLAGKRLWVVTEQGFGDTFFAARFIAPIVAQGCDVIFECKPALRRVLSSLPVRLVPPRLDEPVGVHCDYYVYLMDLPGLFEQQGWALPAPVSLNIPEQARQKFKILVPKVQGILNIGIVWSGSETFGDNLRRSPGLKPFLQLATLPQVRLFSLQKGAREKELDEYWARPYIFDLAPQLEDFADTAASVAELDLVIMSDSAVAHLTASLGKPVWNLLHSNPYWMYGLEAGHCSWYPSMEFIRQPTPGDWAGVFAQVIKKLKQPEVLALAGRTG